MNLPNKLSLARIILVPVFAAFLLATSLPGHYVWALLIFAAASYTDHLDGKIARNRNMITTFGQFLDPLADKVLVMTALICFASMGLCNIWFVLIILLREFAVTSLRLVAVDSGKVIAANKWGKTKTVSQMIASLVVLILQSIQELGGFAAASGAFLLVGNSFVGISCVFTIISGVIYIKQNYQVIEQIK